jgi:large subunit ribosomal protein L24
MKIRKDDNVILLAGKDKGKTGKVVRALPTESKVIVEGLNMVKRHVRPRKEGKKGEIVSVPSPIHVSNVALVDSKAKTAKVASKKVVSDKKTRVSKKSDQKK